MAGRDTAAYSACIDDEASSRQDTEMLKNTETLFFFLATVVALALPAVPALQEALTTGENTLEAPALTVTMERVVITAARAPSPEQVALVR